MRNGWFKLRAPYIPCDCEMTILVVNDRLAVLGFVIDPTKKPGWDTRPTPGCLWVGEKISSQFDGWTWEALE